MLVSNVLIFVSITVVLIALIHKYITRNFNYWKIRGVPGPGPLPFFGNIWDVCTLKSSIGEFVKKIYFSFDEPCIGFFIFDEPFLLIKSPEIVKAILVKDFNNFKDRTIASPKHDEIFANTLFVQKSPQWKNDRSKLTPMFSSAKMKLMFSLVKDTGNNLVEFLKEHPGRHDAKDICNNYSIDVIAKCFFGVDALSFQEKSGHFADVGKAMFAKSIRNGINQSIYFFKTGWVDLMRLRFFDRDVQNFFVKTFLSTVKRREDLKIQATDFVKTLMEISKEDPSFGHNKIASEGMQFFTAGFETSASTIAFTMYEMALNPETQQKLRKEILSNIDKSQDITYNNLKEMKYLHMCVMETLRKYPPLPFLDRRCDMDYPIPGTNFIVEKGTPVYISISAIQNDEKYFPNPEKYDPNRFEENVNENGLIYFPFGFGPRTCIGEAFGLVSVKLALVHLISNFEVERLPTTPVPIVFDPKAFTLQSTVGLPLKFKEIVRSAPLVY